MLGISGRILMTDNGAPEKHTVDHYTINKV